MVAKDYIPVDEPEIIEKKLTTTKSIRCRFGCDCNEIEKLGPFSADFQKWKTNCPARAQRVECDVFTCPNNINCRNRSIGDKKSKVLGVDVEERYTWGVDTYTKNNIFYCLPGDDVDARQNFISNTL